LYYITVRLMSREHRTSECADAQEVREEAREPAVRT